MSIDATTRMFLLLMTISLWKDFQALQMAARVLDWCRFGLVWFGYRQQDALY